MNKIEEIIKLADNEMKFDTPITIKATPHTPIIGIEELAIDDERILDRQVWLKVYKGNWFQLEETDIDFENLANSILQRLRLIKKKPSVILAEYDNNLKATIID